MEKRNISESFRQLTNPNSEKILEIILDNNRIMIAFMDAKFNFIRVNRAYAEAYGREISYFVGKNHFDLYPNEENEEIFKKVVETGQEYIVRAKPHEYAEHPERGLCYWDWTLIPIHENSEVNGLLLIVQEVTKCYIAEQKLKESEDKLRESKEMIRMLNLELEKRVEERTKALLNEKTFTEAALNAQRDTFFVFDPYSGKAVRWNKAFREVTGYTDEEIGILKAPDSYYSEEDLISAAQATQEIREGETTTVIINLITKDGATIPFEYVGSKINDESGNLKYIVSVGRDITERLKFEQKIKESEEKYRFLLNNIDGVVFELDDDGTIKYASPQIFNLYGYLPEEQIGINIMDQVHPDDLESLVTTFDESGEILFFEYRRQHKDGHYVYVNSSAKRVKIDDQYRIIGFTRDITERKKAELALKESEVKYRSLVEGLTQTGIGIDIIDLNYNIIYQNQFLKEQFGDLQNRKCYKHYMDRDMCCEDCPMKRAIQNKRVEKFIMPAPNNRIYEIIAAPLSDPSGTIQKVAEVIIDITEKKRAEEKLKESEMKFRIITEQNLMGIIIIQEDGVIKYVNQGMADLYGYTLEEVFTWERFDVTKFIAPESLETVMKYRKRIKSGEFTHFPMQVIKKSGEKFWVDHISKVITYEGNAAELITQIDITERMNFQQELIKLNSLKSDLIRRTSHEFKTPLISIKGFTQLLVELHKDEFDNYVNNTLNEILSGVERLETLVNDFLKTSELESGSRQIKKSREDLSFLIRLCVNELKGFADLRKHQVNINIMPKLIAYFEKEQIHIVVSNLLSNAYKYTPPEGHIEIDSEIKDNFIIISIRDNGIGFTEEEKSRLFQRFGKIEHFGQGYDIITDGSGLGLYISKMIIDQHSGEIWVESEGRNKGSTFKFTIPIFGS